MTGRKNKPGAGRPPKITKAWCEEKAKLLPTYFEGGASIAEVCVKLGIWKEAYYKAIRISEKFSNAHKTGLTISEAWWARLSQAGALGQKPVQPALCIFNQKARFKWSDKTEQEITVRGEHAISEMSQGEREDLKQKILEKISGGSTEQYN
jgi:transposase-like protein